MPIDKSKLIPYTAYVLPFFFVISPWVRYVFFVIGVLSGMALLVLDQLKLNKYYNEEEQLQQVDQGQQPVFLVTRSTIFLLALIPLSLFVVTSTGSALGGGMIMGLLLGLVLELWEYRHLVQAFRQRFLSQLKTEVSPAHITWIVYGATAFFVFLNILVIT